MTSLVACLILVAAFAVPLPDRARGPVRALACVAALVWMASRFAIVPEDTFISMRYARHLAEGRGLVYNPGEPVEGYTNFLWTVLLALFEAVRLPALETTVWTSIAFGAATVWVTARASRDFGGPGAGVPAAAAALALLPAFWDAAGSGLETSMYAFLVTATAVATARALRDGRAPGAAALVPAVLATLTRPEGIFATGLVLAGAAAMSLGDRARVRRLALLLAVATAVFVAHLLWRRSYYGEWLPNTFYCKVGTTFAQVRRGLEQFLQLLRTGNGLLLAPVALAPWMLRRTPWMAPLLALGCGYTAYVILIGGDNFWRHRYLVPVLPSLLLVSEGVLRHVAADALAKFPAAARSALAAACVVALWGSVDGIKLRPAEGSLADRFATERAFGEWLTKNTPEGRSVAVLAAGVVPYYTDRACIDMLGLNDHHIARVVPPDPVGTRNAGHEKYDWDYVLSRDPEFALMSFSDRPDPSNLLWVSQQRDPTLRTRWHERYETIEVTVAGHGWRIMRRRR